jgi:GT2 family glycosyltransferase
MGVAQMTVFPRVTAVTVLYNNSRLMADLADTLGALGVRAVLYDSGSRDGSADLARSMIPGAAVVSGENLGFGHGNNTAFGKVDTEYVLFLNSDARTCPDSLERMIAFLDSHPDTAGVQPLLRAWRWPLVTAGSGVWVTPFGEAWDARFMHLERETGAGVFKPPAITAAVSLWRSRAFESVNGFDTGYFMYFEDADICLRAGAAGWKFAVLREARGLHRTGGSSDRSAASVWELASSARLARRFLSGGGLPRGFLLREARTELGLLLRGKPWLNRLRALSRSLDVPVSRVTLPDDVRAGLHGNPSDLPLPRPGPLGPGMRGKLLNPYGVFPSDGGEVLLRSPDGDVSGGVCDSDGALRDTFTVPRGRCIPVRLLPDGGLSYIFRDGSKARLEVAAGGHHWKED